MKKTYIVEEICRKTYELEGTELEIQDEIERIMSDSANIKKDPDYYCYTAKEAVTDFEEEVQMYLDNFTPRYSIDDLKQVLGDGGVPPTEENLRRFMEANPRMDAICGLLTEDWYERMSYLVDEGKYDMAIDKWKIDNMTVEIRLDNEDCWDYSELDSLKNLHDAFEIWIDGEMKWNCLYYDNAREIIEGIGYGRKVEVLA